MIPAGNETAVRKSVPWRLPEMVIVAPVMVVLSTSAMLTSMSPTGMAAPVSRLNTVA